MSNKMRFSLFILLSIFAYSCASVNDEPIPEEPVDFRGELGGVNMEMSSLALLFPDETFEFEGITISFVRERSTSTLDVLEINVPVFREDKSIYTAHNQEFMIDFSDSMSLSGANKGEWRSVSGTLQITSYDANKSIKGKIVNAILENVDDPNRTLLLKSAEFEVEAR